MKNLGKNLYHKDEQFVHLFLWFNLEIRSDYCKMLQKNG